MRILSPATPVGRRPPLAALRVGTLNLAVPLRDLRSLEAVLDVDMSTQSYPSVGTIAWHAASYSVFCIDEALKTLGSIPPEHRICAILSGGARGDYGLICSAVEAVDCEKLAMFSVPASLYTPESPVEELILQGRRVLCRTSGATLARFMMSDPHA